MWAGESRGEGRQHVRAGEGRDERAHVEEGEEMAGGREGEVGEEANEEVGAEEYQGKS